VGYLNNYIVPTAFTILLHIIVLFTVLVGWQMSDIKRYRVDTPRYVKARLVTLEQKQERKVQKRQAAAEPVKKAAPAQTTKPVQKPVQKPVPQSTTAPVVKAEPKVAAVPKTEPAPKVPAEPDPAIERQRLREQAQQQQRQDMLQALQEEESLMQAEEDELLADSYAALIKRTVEGNWSRPPSARKAMQVILSIRLIPTGDVVGVEVTQSSGNLAFDRSALNAVEKAARFPELKDMPPSVFEAYFRRFSLVFKPEDLLL
jgi:colicin import membrane protein